MNKSPFLFLGKSEILKYPLIKTYFKHMNIPVYRGTNRKAAKSLVQAMKEIRVGWSIVIFPEGGIPGHENPKMLDFKGGAFQLAKSMKIPIVPITYLNNHKLFSDPTKILGLASPGISKVVIHPTISVEEIEGLTQTELKAKCHKIINEPLKRMYPELID
jgi:1-acyl-sn-glycerol-3-phosphate acyltransferase